jgi:peptide/nickel transport system substrate-binding protein
LNLKSRTICTLLLSLLLLAGACSSPPDTGESLVYGLTLAPSGLDPHLNASAELGIPLSSVYDTLVFRDPDSGDFVPGLADSWKISLDGLTYTFNLRDGVHFHDGTPFDANAVQANIEYVLDPENHSQKAASMLGPLSQVIVLNDLQVAFQLSEPYAPLLDSLSQVYLGMASPAALDEWGPAEYQFHQAGTGPYRFVEYIPNEHIVLERNPEYAWGPSIYRHEQGSIERIEFRFFENEATRSLALESGQVDVIGEVPFREAARLAESSRFTLHPIAIPGQPMQFYFNTSLAPTADPLVREALTRAVDRARVVETLFGPTSPVATGPLSSALFGPLLSGAAPAYDPELAGSLLDQAGWVDLDGDGIREKDGNDLNLILVTPTWGANPQAAQLIDVSWEILGANVEVITAPAFGPLKEQQASNEYHAIGLNFFGTDADLLRESYSSSGFFNWCAMDDPDLDRLLEAGASSFSDQAERDGFYRSAIERIDRAYLVLPVRDYVNLVVARSDLAGLRFSLQGWFPFLIDLEFSS